MLKLGLTGNIASGKSQAEKIFKEFSIPVIDADEMVKKLYCDKSFVRKLRQYFEKFDFIEKNVINKEKLLKILFSDENFKNEFEKFVHPFVLREIEKFFEENSLQSITVASVPLLFEAGWEKYFDKILLITAGDEIRLERLIKRNSISKEDAMMRINAQIPQAEKKRKADFIIENNSDLEELNKKIKDLLGSLK